MSDVFIDHTKEAYMKFYIPLLIIFLLTSCTSTQKVAEYRNAEFSKSNYYETFKFWRELDIWRFEEDLLNIKIGIVPENLSNFRSKKSIIFTDHL